LIEMIMNETRHIPVLLEEAVAGMTVRAGDTVVDATFGGGSHAQRLLQRVGPSGRVIAFDRDASAFARFKEHASVPENLVLVHANYSELEESLSTLGVTEVDAVLADLGFSSDQIETPERGLSFLEDGPLDMRLNQDDVVTAQDVVMTKSEDELEYIFRVFGEEPAARKIARELVKARASQDFATTKQLADFLEALMPRKPFGKSIHPATKVFQALRIFVNEEDQHLRIFLQAAITVLRPGGRLSVIAFHSGEDRIVKEFLQTAEQSCVCPREFPVCRCEQKQLLKRIQKKGIRPSPEEVAENPRSRSAILRVAEKM
jgi:16S rRNA (cytosine1402-N4)-methyltransferase